MNRPLRIGFDVSQSCQERAGCGWFVDSLAHALVTVEPENEYFLYHHFDQWLNEDTDTGTRIESPRVHGPLRGLSVEEAAVLWQQVRAGTTPLPGEPEIVQANSYQAPSIGKARLVFFVHDVSYWVHPEFSTDGNRLHCQDGIFAALARADGFLFNSEFSHREFDRILAGWLQRSGKPWAVTPLGQREHALMPESIAGDGEFWLAVGTLEPRKNYETLLDALELYWSRSECPIPLRIVGGDGWKSEALRQHLAELEIQGRVQTLGYLPDDDLSRLYAQTRALVFPSWYEGFGMPVLEAMSHGAPVICSDRASLPEIGGDAAIYVDPSSAESICNAMLELETAPSLRRRLASAGQRQAARFHWDKTARATLDFYRRVLDTPLSHSP